MTTVPKELTPEVAEVLESHTWYLYQALWGAAAIKAGEAEYLHAHGLLKIKRPEGQRDIGARFGPAFTGRYVQAAPTALLLRNRHIVEVLYALKRMPPDRLG